MDSSPIKPLIPHISGEWVPSTRNRVRFTSPVASTSIQGVSSVSEIRTTIRNHVRDNPGVHFNAIGRSLDIATGQAQYHLRILRREGHVKRESVCGRTHYFPPTYSRCERESIALLRRETTREIVVILMKQEAVHPADIAEDRDLARSTVEWHLSNLQEYDLLEKLEDGSKVRLRDPQVTYRLLREIEPGFTDRLVDRFTRLADSLLEE